jgi:hypothetical protein
MVLIANVAMGGIWMLAIAAVIVGLLGAITSSSFVWWWFKSTGILNGIAGCFWGIGLMFSIALIRFGGSIIWALR